MMYKVACMYVVGVRKKCAGVYKGALDVDLIFVLITWCWRGGVAADGAGKKGGRE